MTTLAVEKEHALHTGNNARFKPAPTLCSHGEENLLFCVLHLDLDSTVNSTPSWQITEDYPVGCRGNSNNPLIQVFLSAARGRKTRQHMSITALLPKKVNTNNRLIHRYFALEHFHRIFYVLNTCSCIITLISPHL